MVVRKLGRMAPQGGRKAKWPMENLSSGPFPIGKTSPEGIRIRQLANAGIVQSLAVISLSSQVAMKVSRFFRTRFGDNLAASCGEEPGRSGGIP